MFSEQDKWSSFKFKIPHKPGVYIYKDAAGRILYVGKAIDLYSRVSQYFSNKTNAKTAMLVKNISDIETIIVESELEALILEANLIKTYLPPFNVRLTDDKDYLYIAITKEDFPKVITARKSDLKMTKKYWGPFPSSRTVKSTLKSLRRVFPWCSNPPKKLLAISYLPLAANSQKPKAKSNRPCFYYHLKLCPGACVGEISKQDYGQIISRFSKFMDGRKNELIGELVKEMTHASNDQKFEEAAYFKKIIEGVEYLTQSNRTELYLENPNFLEQETKQSLETLKQDLKLDKLPDRIECFDISSIQGKESTGSMVVLTNGEIDKSQYRKFKIKISGKPNDVGMMREMISRRIKHKEWPMPDLIIVDGGKPQVNGAQLEIENWKLKIPIYGLAKRMEWLYSPNGEVLKLPRKSISLKLLQKLRDEAHRFAITYHRKLHRSAILNTI